MYRIYIYIENIFQFIIMMHFDSVLVKNVLTWSEINLIPFYFA